MQEQEAEEVDIFSDDLAGGNVAGRTMIADPTEQMDAIEIGEKLGEK